MNSLLELQSRFTADLFDKNGGSGCWYIRDDGLSGRRRLDIYRNNVFSNYREALRAVYPVVERLVGERFFLQTADEYIRVYPSTTGDLDDYGAQFAEFLAGFPPALSLAYLPDVARLEWLMEEAFHAAEHQPLDVAQLAALPEERYGELTFRLHPACRLFASHYAAGRIWQANQPDWEDEATLDISQGGETLLVYRDGFSVAMRPLRRGEFAMLSMLAGGRSFACAYEWAQNVEADFDVAAFLHEQVAAGTLVDFELNRMQEFELNQMQEIGGQIALA